MTIYFVQPLNGGLVKIGFTSKDVKSRIQELQTGCPDKLTLLGTEPGDEQREASLHVQFADLRVNGEWFRPDVRLMRHIIGGTLDVNAIMLGTHARSYVNCLWSHCICDGVNKPLVELLYQHAQYVSVNATECWEFLREHGVKEVQWKYCQYFFALCWPIHEPWMALNRKVVTTLIEQGLIQDRLPLWDMYQNVRPITEAALNRS